MRTNGDLTRPITVCLLFSTFVTSSLWGTLFYYLRGGDLSRAIRVSYQFHRRGGWRLSTWPFDQMKIQLLKTTWNQTFTSLKKEMFVVLIYQCWLTFSTSETTSHFCWCHQGPVGRENLIAHGNPIKSQIDNIKSHPTLFSVLFWSVTFQNVVLKLFGSVQNLVSCLAAYNIDSCLLRARETLKWFPVSLILR